MKKAVIFIDSEFYYDYLEAHGIEDENSTEPLNELAAALTAGGELSLDVCGDDLLVLDCKVSEEAARTLIQERTKEAYKVTDVEDVLRHIEFWPAQRYGEIADLPPEKLKVERPKDDAPEYKIEFRFSLNFYEDYEEMYPVFREEGLNMPALQLIMELGKRADVSEAYGAFNVICRGDVHSVIEFIKYRLAQLCLDSDIAGIGFLTWEPYDSK